MTERKIKCETLGHPYPTEIGVGFGAVDYFCQNCGHIVRSVSIDELDSVEAKRIGAFVTNVLADFPFDGVEPTQPTPP